MYAYNELLFPPETIPHLRHLRDERWKALIDRVVSLPEDHPEALALSLLMIRLTGCLSCETDSYRAMRGCTACARQILRRFKGPDSELTRRYKEALGEVRSHLQAQPLTVGAEMALSVRAA